MEEDNRVHLLEGYNGQVNPRKPRITLVGSLIFLFMVLIGAIIGAMGVHQYNTLSIHYPRYSADPAEPIRAVCSVTRHRHSCFTTIFSSYTAAIANYSKDDDFTLLDPEIIFTLSLRVAINNLANLSSLPKALISNSTDSRTELALRDCASLFDDALSQLNRSASLMRVIVPGKASLTEAEIGKMKTWIGGAMNDQKKCLDGLKKMESTAADEVRTKVQESKVYTSNSLAILWNMINLINRGDWNFFEFKFSVFIFCLEFLISIWLFCLLFRIR